MADANVTIGMVVDQSGLAKASWPGDYTVHIKQEVDSSGLRNASFLGDYVQTVTQHLVRDNSWKNLVLIGDHTATTHMVLDDRALRAGLYHLPNFVNNQFTVHGMMMIRGQQEVDSAIQMLQMLPSEYHVDGKFNGHDVRQGISALANDCKNMNDVLAKMELLFQGGDKNAKVFGDALRNALKMGGSVMSAQKAIDGITKSIDGRQLAKLTSNNQWKQLQQFVAEGQRIGTSGTLMEKNAWQTQYTTQYKGEIAAMKSKATEIANSNKQHLRDLEAIDNAYRNISRAIEGVNAKAGQFGIGQSQYRAQMKDMKSLQRDLDMARQSGDAVLVNAAMKRIREGEVKDAARKAYGALGYLNTEKKTRERKEISDAGYAGRIQGLKNQANALETTINKLAGKGQDITHLQTALAKTREYINSIADTKAPVDRINAITEAIRRLAETRNNANKLSVGAAEYKRLERQEEAEQRKRLQRLETLDSQLQRAFNSASKKNGETPTMRGWFDQGKAYIDRARTMSSNENEYQSAKSDVNEIIRLLDEEARKTQAVAESRKRVNQELERAESRVARVEGVIRSKEQYVDKNTAIASQIQLLKGYNDAMRRAAASSDGKYNGRSFKEYLADSKNAEAGLNAMTTAFKQLGTQIRQAEAELRNYDRMQQKGLTNTNIEANKKALEQMLEFMRRAQATGDAQSMMNARYMGMGGIEQARNARVTEQMNANAKAMNAADEAARRYAQQLDKISQGHSQNISLASDLRQQIVGLYSVQQLRSWFNNLIEIGGQFEYQRASISNILKDAGKAEVLFTRIKELALKSPFSTIELDQAAKELTAFEVPYDNLFKKLKQIADVSAGTGTDISRIILAYGHVKSAGYLEGMQRRQFTNANINIVGELAKLYGEREGKPVSRVDIYSRIHDKKVTYEDVDAVFERMTSAGGQFENMQEAMADTTKGVWKNLSDAVNHMYMDIEKNNAGLLKGIGSTLMALTKAGATLIPILSHLGIGLAVMGARRNMMTAATGKETSSIIRNARALKVEQHAVWELTQGLAGKQMVSKTLTKEELDMLIRSKNLTREDLLRAIATRELTKAEGQHLVMLGKITQKELDTLLATNATTNAMSAGAAKLGASFKTMGLGIKSMLASIPQMLAFSLALEGVMWAGKKLGEVTGWWGDGMDNSLRNMNELSVGSAKAIRESISDTTADDIKKMNNEQVGMFLEDSSRVLKENVVAADAIIKNLAVDKPDGFLEAQIEKASKLHEIMQKIADINDEADNGGNDVFKGFVDNTNGWFNDSYETNLKEYSEDMSKMHKAQGKLASVNHKTMELFKKDLMASKIASESLVKNTKTIGELFDKIFKDKDAAKSLYDYNDYKDKDWWGGSGHNKIDNAIDAFKTAYESYRTVMSQSEKIVNDYLNYNNLQKVVDKDGKVLGVKGADGKMLGFDSKQYLDLMQKLNNFHLSVEGLDPKWAEQIQEEISKQIFNVILHPKLDENAKTAWKEELKEAFHDNKQIALVIDAAPDIAAAMNGVQQLYDEVYKKWESLKQGSKALGIDIGFNLKPGQDYSGKKKELEARRTAINNELSPLRGVLAPTDQNTKRAKYLEGQLQALDEALGVIDMFIELNNAFKAGYLSKPQGYSDPKKNSKKTGSGHEDTSDEGRKKWDDENDAVDQLESVLLNFIQQYGAENAQFHLELDDTWKKMLETAKKIPGFDSSRAYDRKYYQEWRKDRLEKGIYSDKNATKKANAEARTEDELKLGRQIQETELKEERENIERAIKGIEAIIDARKEKLNIYSKMFDATSSKEYANMLQNMGKTFDFDSFFAYDDAKQAIKDFNAKMKKEVTNAKGNHYTYASLSKYSEEDLLGVKESIVDAFRAAQKEVAAAEGKMKERLIGIIENFRSANEKLQDERKRNERELNLVASAEKKGWITPEMAETIRSRSKAMLNQKELEASFDYYRFFLDSTGVFDGTLNEIGAKIKDNLVERMKAGTIEAKDYYEQLQKVDDILKKNDTNRRRDTRLYNLFGVNGTRQERNDRMLEEAKRQINAAQEGLRNTDWYKKLNPSARDLVETNMSTGSLNLSNVDTDDEAVKALVKKLMEAIDNKGTADKKKTRYEKIDDVSKVIGKVNEGLSGFAECCSGLLDMLDKLGININVQLRESIEASINALNGLGTGVEQIINGNYFTGAVSVLSTMFKLVQDLLDAYEKQISDNISHLQKYIGELDKIVSGVQNDMSNTFGLNGESRSARIRGNLYKHIASTLHGSVYDENGTVLREYTKNRKAYNYYNSLANSVSGKNAYELEMAMLKKKTEKLESEKIESLKRGSVDIDELDGIIDELAEVKERIETLAADYAKDIFGIDFKQWSQTLTDAMIEAFQNGEDAALKWQQTVDQIIRDVSKSMINKLITEQIIQPVYEDFLANTKDKKGKWVNEDGTLNDEAIRNGGLYDLHSALTNKAQSAIPAIETITNAINDLTWTAGTANGGSLTKIGQSLTEETGSVMAGYLNNINGNTGAIRTIADSQLQQLQVIAGHTAFIAAHIEKMANCTEHLEVLSDVVNGAKAFKIQ